MLYFLVRLLSVLYLGLLIVSVVFLCYLLMVLLKGKLLRKYFGSMMSCVFGLFYVRLLCSWLLSCLIVLSMEC